MLTYENDIINALNSVEQFTKSKVMNQSLRSTYETERKLNECQSYIMQLRIDQKSMPPSNKKRDLKSRLAEYSAKYYTLETDFNRLKLSLKGDSTDTTNGMGNSSDSDQDTLLNSSCDMEFDSAMQVEGGKGKSRLTNG